MRNVPVIIDAGIGTPSEATSALEIGAEWGLIKYICSTSLKNPAQMAKAMNLGVKAGRLGYLSGRMEKKSYATASSPLQQISKIR